MGKFEVRQDTGYGLIPRSVMRDSNLSIEAKAIYSYLASFAGNTGKSYPSTDLISRELNISRNRLFKYLKELKEKEVITVKRTKGEGGQFGRNVYYLHNEVKTPSLHFTDTGNTDMDNADMENEDTNSNNINSNNINSNKDKDDTTIPKEVLDAIITKWNDVAKQYNIPQVKIIKRDTTRYQSLNARYREYGLETLLEGIDSIHRSKFLQGNSNVDWAITFDWYIAKSNTIKVLEGNYEDRKPTNSGTLNNPNYRVSTLEDKARDEDGNLLEF